MAECTHCGGFVSERFARVFGDDDREVYACQRCAPNAGIADVARDRSHES